jgi:hypothetical protein
MQIGFVLHNLVQTQERFLRDDKRNEQRNRNRTFVDLLIPCYPDHLHPVILVP